MQSSCGRGAIGARHGVKVSPFDKDFGEEEVVGAGQRLEPTSSSQLRAVAGSEPEPLQCSTNRGGHAEPAKSTALLLLADQIPPRRGAQQRPMTAASQLANPAEWICLASSGFRGVGAGISRRWERRQDNKQDNISNTFLADTTTRIVGGYNAAIRLVKKLQVLTIFPQKFHVGHPTLPTFLLCLEPPQAEAGRQRGHCPAPFVVVVVVVGDAHGRGLPRVVVIASSANGYREACAGLEQVAGWPSVAACVVAIAVVGDAGDRHWEGRWCGVLSDAASVVGVCAGLGPVWSALHWVRAAGTALARTAPLPQHPRRGLVIVGACTAQCGQVPTSQSLSSWSPSSGTWATGGGQCGPAKVQGGSIAVIAVKGAQAWKRQKSVPITEPVVVVIVVIEGPPLSFTQPTSPTAPGYPVKPVGLPFLSCAKMVIKTHYSAFSRTSPTESSTPISSTSARGLRCPSDPVPSLGTNALLLHPRDDDDDHDDVDMGCDGGHLVNGAGAFTLGDGTIHHPAARTPDRDDDDNTGCDRGHSALVPVSHTPPTTTTTRARRAVCTSTGPSHPRSPLSFAPPMTTTSDPTAAAPTVWSNDDSSGSDEGDSDAPAAAPNPDDNGSEGSRISR
ncbi:hypothetical protein EDB85DRAFT_2270664 [Lactarius pseudohatsudake]|nr:hypothetical protein EDB85DRAFT_2270664 [Lactarius pseudohatsudake]